MHAQNPAERPWASKDVWDKGDVDDVEVATLFWAGSRKLCLPRTDGHRHAQIQTQSHMDTETRINTHACTRAHVHACTHTIMGRRHTGARPPHVRTHG